MGSSREVAVQPMPQRRQPSPLRLLYCTLAYGPGARGGAERQAQLLAEQFAKLGHSVQVVCPRTPRIATGVINGVRVTTLPFIDRRPFKTVTFATVLGGFLALRIRRFDIVHVHLAFIQSDVACLVARIARVPVWVKLAASGPFGELGRARKIAWLTRWIGVRWATRVQALSPEIAAELLEVGVSPSQIVALPNAVDTRRFTPASDVDRAPLRRRLELPADSVIAMYAGRLAKHKGIPELLTAWQHLGPKNACLLIVGSRATMDAVSAIPADPSVCVREWSDRVEDYYRAADLFILPSHVEGMSNALLEAMACGLPAIASTVGAASELIRPDVNGLLVEPSSPVDLEQALNRLLSDSELRNRLGSAARNTSLQYSIDAVAPRLLANYEEMLQPKC